jgi:hypothetical protein
LKDSAAIAARLSRTRTNNVVSPNPYAALETCSHDEYHIPDSTDVPQLLLKMSSEAIDSLCKDYWNDQNKSECIPDKCFWHQGRKSKKPRDEENKHVSSPKLTNAGSERRKRSSNPESKGNRPLNRGTSRDSDRTNQSTSKQNNQKP